MTSRGSRRLLLSGSELKNEGAERRPFSVSIIDLSAYVASELERRVLNLDLGEFRN